MALTNGEAWHKQKNKTRHLFGKRVFLSWPSWFRSPKLVVRPIELLVPRFGWQSAQDALRYFRGYC